MHVDADDAAVGRGAQLHEVAELVDQVQAAAADLVGAGQVAARERVGDVAAVGDLTSSEPFSRQVRSVPSPRA